MACRFTIRAIPNARRNRVMGWLGGFLRVKVHAPATDGRANDALCDFLAETLGVSRRCVSLVSGEKSRQKVIQVEGLALAEAKARLLPG